MSETRKKTTMNCSHFNESKLDIGRVEVKEIKREIPQLEIELYESKEEKLINQLAGKQGNENHKKRQAQINTGVLQF